MVTGDHISLVWGLFLSKYKINALTDHYKEAFLSSFLNQIVSIKVSSSDYQLLNNVPRDRERVTQVSHVSCTGRRFFTTSATWWIIFRCVTQSCLTLYDRMDCSPPWGSWNSPDKNTGVGCHFLLQVFR